MMLVLLSLYVAIPITTRVQKARVNDAGVVAGIRLLPTGKAKTLHDSNYTLGPHEAVPEAFVWRDGKIVFHDVAFTVCAGPNAKGQVALGGPKGLFLWENGELEECVPTPVRAIAGIADDGSIVASATDASDSFRATASIAWPSDHTAEGKYRFGPRRVTTPPFGPPTVGGPPSTVGPPNIVEYALDGGFVTYRGPMRASQTDGGTEVRTPVGFWAYSTQDPYAPHRLAPSGYAVAFRRFGKAIDLWHNGDLLELDISPESVGQVLAVNGKGEAVGTLDGRATYWKDERRIALGEEVGGPKLEGAIAISENGNVLATSGSMLYLLRRRG